MNKKAMIGDTLTWIVAFLIIFFIMLIFDVVALGLAKSKTNQPIILSENNVDLISMSVLSSILQTEVEFNNQAMTLSQLIILWRHNYNDEQVQSLIEEKIKEEVENILNKTKNSDSKYYLFNVRYKYYTEIAAGGGVSYLDKGNLNPSTTIDHIKEINIEEKPFSPGDFITNNQHEDLVNSALSLKIYDNQELVTVKLKIYN